MRRDYILLSKNRFVWSVIYYPPDPRDIFARAFRMSVVIWFSLELAKRAYKGCKSGIPRGYFPQTPRTRFSRAFEDNPEIRTPDGSDTGGLGGYHPSIYTLYSSRTDKEKKLKYKELLKYDSNRDK